VGPRGGGAALAVRDTPGDPAARGRTDARRPLHGRDAPGDARPGPSPAHAHGARLFARADDRRLVRRRRRAQRARLKPITIRAWPVTAHIVWWKPAGTIASPPGLSTCSSPSNRRLITPSITRSSVSSSGRRRRGASAVRVSKVSVVP